MIRRPPRSTLDRSSAASDVYKRQGLTVQVRQRAGLIQPHHSGARYCLCAIERKGCSGSRRETHISVDDGGRIRIGKGAGHDTEGAGGSKVGGSRACGHEDIGEFHRVDDISAVADRAGNSWEMISAKSTQKDKGGKSR